MSSHISLTRARSLMRVCRRRGLPWAMLQGYRWLVGSFLPALKTLDAEQTTRADETLASDCYYLLGDVYFCCEAPRAAIRAYKRSYRLDPNCASPLGDIGENLTMMGRFDEAAKYYRRGLRIDPTEEYCLGGLESLSEIRWRIGLYVEGDPVWQAHEHLCRAQPRAALSVLRRRRTIGAKRARAMAYGVLEDAPNALLQWQGIAQTTGRIELSEDWFFLPDMLWDLPEFWETLIDMIDRVHNLGVYDADDEMGPPKLRERDLSNYPTKRIHLLVVQCQKARSSGNVRRLRSLAKRFPRWNEPRLVLQHMQATGEILTRRGYLELAETQRS
ncbi:MAG: tetratricopeptide repeat protein [Planctomycetes bacterium]|nr:tetratricopeptide repeat protein [Planctomycetota bacterium]